MTNDHELTLRDVALAASQKHGGVRGRALGRAAEKAGLTLSYTTVDKILNGTYTSRPSDETLRALSSLAGVPLEKVFDAAKRPLPMASLAARLPADADSLDPEQQQVVLAVVRQFASLNRRLAETRGETHGSPTTDAEVTSATEMSSRRGRRVSDPAPTVREDVAALDDDDLLKEREAQQEQP